jgi:hypothetical protein
MEHPKNRGVTFWTERIGPIIIKIWHQLQNQFGSCRFCNRCHILIIIGPILPVQSVTPRFLGCSIFPNILVIYQILFLMLFQNFKKHRSSTVATLTGVVSHLPNMITDYLYAYVLSCPHAYLPHSFISDSGY